jgi:tetratricopeptide (TPR) repeat protein
MTLLKFLGICVVGMALSLPAYADRGSAAYKKGTRAERQANLDAAYGFYNQAHTLSPRNAKYFMASTQMRFRAANEHVHNGQLLRNTGELEQSLTQFQQAVEIDPSNFLAHQELRLTEDLLRQREEQRAAPAVESPLAGGAYIGRYVCAAEVADINSDVRATGEPCGPSNERLLTT